MNVLLKRILGRLVRTGNLTVTGPKGSIASFRRRQRRAGAHAHQDQACRTRHHLRSDAGGARSLYGRRTRHPRRRRAGLDAHRLPEHRQRRHRRHLDEGDRRAAARLPPPPADQHGGALAPQRAAPLRPVGRPLPALPRRGHAVFLRLFRAAGHDARRGAARQEAPHRRQAQAEGRPDGARHRLGLGRARPLSRPVPSRSTSWASPCRPSSMAVATDRAHAAGPGKPRPFRAQGLPRPQRALRPHRLGRHVRACRRQSLPHLLRQVARRC